MIQQLHQEIADILKSHPFNISKNLKISHSLYQNKVSVINISDAYLRFALDIGFVNEKSSQIYIKPFARNTNTERIIKNTEAYRSIQKHTEQYGTIQNNTNRYLFKPSMTGWRFIRNFFLLKFPLLFLLTIVLMFCHDC